MRPSLPAGLPLLASALLLQASAQAACLAGGDDTTINTALSAAGAQVELCPGAVFRLTKPVVLAHDGQSLGTARPTSQPGKKSKARQTSPFAQAATLLVTGADQASAIVARASNIRVHDLIIDGQRRALGRLPKGQALIALGGSGVHDVRIDHLRAFDPRGWSTLHAFEGDKTCTRVTIEDSHFGPAGTADGAWADGISLACRDSTVRRNVIEDATDGAIVVFGAPGSLIEDNQIVTRRAVLLGGINLVDFKPYDGDYTGTRVRRNRIHAEGGFIKIGIAIGPSVWGADNQTFIHGASVTDNVISGPHLGYGIAADGARDVDISRNQVLSAFNGRIGEHCYKHLHLPKSAQVVNPARTSGHRDAGMAATEVRYAICIEPPDAK